MSNKKAAQQVSGQKSLFSFFSKAAPKPVDKGKEKINDKDKYDEERMDVDGVSGKDTPQIQSQSSAATSKEASPTIQQASSLPLGKVSVNDRIAIYWPNDDEWYEGVITEYDSFKKQHKVNYDDGQVESLNLANEKFKILKDSSSITSNKRGYDEDDDEEDDTMAQPTRKAKTNAS